jgi:hypothetical protein
MKKRTITLCLALSLLFIPSCSNGSSDTYAPVGGSSGIDYQSSISALEAQIAELKQNHALAESERQQKIDELTGVINTLKAELEKTDDKVEQKPEDNGTDDSVNVTPGFKYILNGTDATITGYTGEEKQLVIPASVDGYRVSAIADGAFENTDIKSVIISDGIVSIGWFAFNGCTSLRSITIPSSVTGIGYLALGEAGANLTVYCHSDTFAFSYAKSYGLKYTVI